MSPAPVVALKTVWPFSVLRWMGLCKPNFGNVFCDDLILLHEEVDDLRTMSGNRCPFRKDHRVWREEEQLLCAVVHFREDAPRNVIAFFKEVIKADAAMKNDSQTFREIDSLVNAFQSGIVSEVNILKECLSAGNPGWHQQ